MRPPVQLLLRGRRKPAFDEIDPRATARREVHVKAFMLEPGDLVYRTVVRADEQRATVTGTATLTSGPMPIIDLTFRQQGSLVRAESRWVDAGGIRRGG